MPTRLLQKRGDPSITIPAVLAVALLALAHAYPKKLSEKDLIDTVERHHFNLRMPRLRFSGWDDLFDRNPNGALRLLVPGLKRAEEIRKHRTVN